jgi:hypothetical protein
MVPIEQVETVIDPTIFEPVPEESGGADGSGDPEGADESGGSDDASDGDDAEDSAG